MFAAITDTAGGHLAYATIVDDHDTMLALSLATPGSRENLFMYYFHKGGRRVVVDLEETALEGVLRTRMEGNSRQWWVTPKRTDDEPPPLTMQYQGELLPCCPRGQRCEDA
jgi:hypothetical protein